MIKRLIFDVDGTLITNVNFNDAIKRTLIKINAYSKENFNSFLNGINTYENKFNNYNINDYTYHISSAINKNLSEEFLNIFFEELKNTIPNENVGLIKTIKELGFNSNANKKWMNDFTNLDYIEKLEKKIIDDLIEDIVIDNEGNIRIIFKCEDKYFEALDFINKEKCDIIENEFLLA